MNCIQCKNEMKSTDGEVYYCIECGYRFSKLEDKEQQKLVKKLTRERKEGDK